MQSLLCKVAVFLWFIATNVIAAAALEATVRYPRFKIHYFILAIVLIGSYLCGLYYRIRRERDRGVSESVIRYYLRTRLSKHR
jgi:NADH:ubiquinone oxidoreductase subunit 3 (subunit A)